MSVRQWLCDRIAFREANHSDLVARLEQLPKYPAPRKYEPTPARKPRTLTEWKQRYAA